MTATAGKRNYKTYIHAAIMLLIMIGAHFVPSVEPITPMGMQIIGVFVGMIWGWIFCELLWPSLLGIVMLGFTEYAGTVEGAVGIVLSNSTVISMFFAVTFFAFISASGLLDIAMDKLLTCKFAVGKPWNFITFFLVASAILSLAFNVIVLMLLSFDFLGKLFQKLGYTKEDLLPNYMFLGIGIFAGYGMLLIPYMPTALITKGLITTCLGGVPLDLLQWVMVIDVPLFICWTVYILVGRFILRVDTTKLAEGSQIILEEMENREKKPMTEEQKYALGALIIFVVLNAATGIFPKTLPVIAQLNRLGIVGITLISLVGLAVLQLKNGKPIANIAKAAKDGTNWPLLFLVGAIMTITKALTTQETGVAAAMVKWVVPMVSNVSIVMFVIIVTCAICLVSQVSMNMVLTMTFAPILTPIVAQMGYNPLIAVMAVLLGAKLAYLSPSGCQQAAVVYGQKDWTVAKNLQKCCIPWALITLPLWIICALVIPDMIYHV